eukprot:COSAG04_NODE_5541_length_1578_cov_2.221095_2_plen_109_part_00
MPASASAQLALDLRKFFAVVPTGSAGVGERAGESQRSESRELTTVLPCVRNRRRGRSPSAPSRDRTIEARRARCLSTTSPGPNAAAASGGFVASAWWGGAVKGSAGYL